MAAPADTMGNLSAKQVRVEEHKVLTLTMRVEALLRLKGLLGRWLL